MEIKFYLLVSISIVTFLVLYLTGQFVLRFWIQPRFLGLFFRGKRGFNEYCTINKFQNFDCKLLTCLLNTLDTTLIGLPVFFTCEPIQYGVYISRTIFQTELKILSKKKKKKSRIPTFFFSIKNC